MNKNASRWQSKLFNTETSVSPDRLEVALKHKQTGELVGEINANVANNVAYVEHSWVHPEFQNTGTGKLLYKHVAHNAKQQGATHLASDAAGITSSKAARVWESLSKQHELVNDVSSNAAKYLLKLK